MDSEEQYIEDQFADIERALSEVVGHEFPGYFVVGHVHISHLRDPEGWSSGEYRAVAPLSQPWHENKGLLDLDSEEFDIDLVMFPEGPYEKLLAGLQNIQNHLDGDIRLIGASIHLVYVQDHSTYDNKYLFIRSSNVAPHHIDAMLSVGKTRLAGGSGQYLSVGFEAFDDEEED